MGYVQPYAGYVTPMGGDAYPPATATVEPDNPVGGAFTLPSGFIDYVGSFTTTPKTGWEGYTTVTGSHYYNGPGIFAPSNGPTSAIRTVFPTTGGNPSTSMGSPIPNYGTGQPASPTSTFSGLFDFPGARPGSLQVTPGPNRFGGTFRIFSHSTAFFYQYVYLFDPAFYKAYGEWSCLKSGVTCTPDTFRQSVGSTTNNYRIPRFLLNVKGSGTGDGLQSNTAKATTPIGNGGYSTPYGSASFLTIPVQYFGFHVPFTTGWGKASNPVGDDAGVISPRASGYDTDLGGTDITITRTATGVNWNKTLNDITYTYETFKTYLDNVGRVVSMVKPRLVWAFMVPLDTSTDPITSQWQVARLDQLRVYFVPEPVGMLMLGTGIAALLGVSRMRRR